MENKKIKNIKNNIDSFKATYAGATTVQKRKITRLIKALTKEIKQIQYANSSKASNQSFSKQLLNAGAAYNEERNKGFTINKQERIRERNKYEKGEALGAFKVVSYFDNLWYDHAYTATDKITNKPKLIIINVPNYTVIKQLIESELRRQIETNNSKHKLSGFVTIKYTVESEGEEVNRYFNSEIAVFNSSHVIHSFIVNLISAFENELEQAKNASNYTFLSVEKLDVKTAKSKAIVGGSFIELPEFIKNKKACINIINDDEKCFIWSILAFNHYSAIKGGCKNKASTYKKYLNEIKEPDGVTYPLNIDFVPEFEKLNNLKINIFELREDNSIGILHNSTNKYKTVVNLLWFQKDNNSHYVWIKDINKLDKHNVATHASMYRCEYCLAQRFLTKEALFKHIEICLQCDKNCNEILPEEGKNILKFQNVGNKFSHPFHVVADFESTLVPVIDNEKDELDCIEYNMDLLQIFHKKTLNIENILSLGILENIKPEICIYYLTKI